MPITPATPAEVEQILTLLAKTPLRIAAAVSGVEEAALTRSADLKTWSANQILAHLRGCSDVWGETIRAMLEGDRPELALVHPREWTKRQAYARQPFGASFQVFERERIELLGLLHGIPFADWDRSAIIGGRFPTVFSQAQRMAFHEDRHCEEIEALLSRGS